MGDTENFTCEELGEGYIEPTFSEKLSDWLSRTNVENLEARLFVYKYEGNGEEKSLCGKYTGTDIPDEHELGLEHGSGKYLAIAHIPPGSKQAKKTNSWKFRISARYDELRKQKILENNPFPGYPAPYPYHGRDNTPPAPVPAPMDNIKQLAELVAVLKPLLSPASSPLQEMQFGQKIMMANFETMQEIMKSNLLDTSKTIREALRQNMPGDVMNGEFTEEDEEEGEGGIMGQLEKIIPLLEEFIPKLLAKGPVGSATASMVRSLPQYREVVKNTEDVKKLVDFVEKKHGKEATETLLKRLKISRPS